MSSKYDSAQVVITTTTHATTSTNDNNNSNISDDQHHHTNSSSSSYVLSRLAVARLLAFVEIDPITANRVALSVKKALVDANELQISHRHLFQKVLEILTNNFNITLAENDARLLAQYWKARPLIVVILKMNNNNKSDQDEVLAQKPQQQQIKNENKNTILLSISQRLCDAAILDSNLLLQVDDIVSGLFSSSSSSSSQEQQQQQQDEDLKYRQQSVTCTIAAESCRAYSRGGALVVGGPREYFDSSINILKEMRSALKGSFLQHQQSNHGDDSLIPACVLIVDFVGEQKNTKKSTRLQTPLTGNCLEVVEENENHQDCDEESTSKKLVSYIRESLAETLLS